MACVVFDVVIHAFALMYQARGVHVLYLQILREALLKYYYLNICITNMLFWLFRVLNYEKRRPFNCNVTFDFTTASVDTSTTPCHNS